MLKIVHREKEAKQPATKCLILTKQQQAQAKASFNPTLV